MAKKNQPKEPSVIETQNAEYKKEKAALAKLNAPGGLKDAITKFQIDINNEKADYQFKQTERDNAKLIGDAVAADKAQAEMDAIKTNIETIKGKLERVQAMLDKAQKSVDDRIGELGKDPETKQKLDTILYKRYDRECNKKITEKEKLQKKYDELKDIKDIIDNDNVAKVYFGNLEKSQAQAKNLNHLIKKLNDKAATTPLTTEEQKKLADYNTKLLKVGNEFNTNKNALIMHFKVGYKEVKLNDQKVNDLLEMKKLEKEIKGYDKSIANYQKLMDGLDVSKDVQKMSKTEQEENLPVVGGNKPSWLHPIKRIKHIINEKKAKREAAKNPQPSMNEQKKSLRDKVRLSKDEYESDIVKDYLENRKQELYKQAREDRKNNGTSR